MPSRPQAFKYYAPDSRSGRSGDGDIIQKANRLARIPNTAYTDLAVAKIVRIAIVEWLKLAISTPNGPIPEPKPPIAETSKSVSFTYDPEEDNIPQLVETLKNSEDSVYRYQNKSRIYVIAANAWLDSKLEQLIST